MVFFYKNIHLICLISAPVTYKDFHCLLDKVFVFWEKQKLFWEKQAAVDEMFYPRFKVKYSFLFRSFSTWD